jgi:ABC-2 type transport system permease protein
VRTRVLLSKAVVIVATAFVTGVVLSVVGSLAAAPFAGNYGTFTADQFVDTAFATGVHLGLASAMVLGLGAVLRSSAGTITIALAVLFVLPEALPIFGIGWLDVLADHLPSSAGLVLGLQLEDPYGAAAAVVVLTGWALAGIVAGAVLLRHRDA